MLMHESLVRLENMMTELGTTDLLSQIGLRAMVTLMVENVFSLMRNDDPMPTQLEYEILLCLGASKEDVSWPFSLLDRPYKLLP